jgi:hypothetical protein
MITLSREERTHLRRRLFVLLDAVESQPWTGTPDQIELAQEMTEIGRKLGFPESDEPINWTAAAEYDAAVREGDLGAIPFGSEHAL